MIFIKGIKMGLLNALKKRVVKATKGVVGLPKNQKLTTTAKKAVKKAIIGKK
jgi:hypothetical protein